MYLGTLITFHIPNLTLNVSYLSMIRCMLITFHIPYHVSYKTYDFDYYKGEQLLSS